MAQVKVVSTLVNENTKVKQSDSYFGVKREDKLVYQNQSEKFEWIFQKSGVTLRKTKKDESMMMFHFSLNDSSTLSMKTSFGNLEVPMETKKLIIEENKIDVIYELNQTEVFHLLIECR